MSVVLQVFGLNQNILLGDGAEEKSEVTRFMLIHPKVVETFLSTNVNFVLLLEVIMSEDHLKSLQLIAWEP